MIKEILKLFYVYSKIVLLYMIAITLAFGPVAWTFFYLQTSDNIWAFVLFFPALFLWGTLWVAIGEVLTRRGYIK